MRNDRGLAGKSVFSLGFVSPKLDSVRRLENRDVVDYLARKGFADTAFMPPPPPPLPLSRERLKKYNSLVFFYERVRGTDVRSRIRSVFF